MKIPKSLYVEPTVWAAKKKTYDYSYREITIEDIVGNHDVERIEAEADNCLNRLKRDGRTWELDAVLVGSPIEARNTVIVFRTRRHDQGGN
ncbi:MAG: hypothetical protein HRU82_06900 [Nitrospira sp.]|nr:MAG: hypothetical protein HRU82_06900 [Nitrospira sp.]